MSKQHRAESSTIIDTLKRTRITHVGELGTVRTGRCSLLIATRDDVGRNDKFRPRHGFDASVDSDRRDGHASAHAKGVGGILAEDLQQRLVKPTEPQVKVVGVIVGPAHERDEQFHRPRVGSVDTRDRLAVDARAHIAHTEELYDVFSDHAVRDGGIDERPEHWRGQADRLDAFVELVSVDRRGAARGTNGDEHDRHHDAAHTVVKTRLSRRRTDTRLLRIEDVLNGGTRRESAARSRPSLSPQIDLIALTHAMFPLLREGWIGPMTVRRT